MRAHTLALLLIVIVAAAACAGESPATDTEEHTDAAGDDDRVGGLSVQPASYDLAATGEAERFLVGALTAQNEGLVGGTVQLDFAFLGRGDASGSPEPGPSAEAAFLPVPNKAPEEVPDQPTVMAPADGVGVYETEVAFDRPGFWEVTVSADVAGHDTMTGTGAFRVFDEHLVPRVGDEAIPVENLTVDDAGEVPPAAVDSRAGSDGSIPDPELHQTTIADALAQQRPVVVVFSTPVYCQSQFCGPITEAVADLADRYGDRAAFVHVEVWRDYEDTTLNDAYDTWANKGEDVGVEGAGEGREPWVFAVDADGRVAHRWDNVPDIEALEAWLRQLPAS